MEPFEQLKHGQKEIESSIRYYESLEEAIITVYMGQWSFKFDLFLITVLIMT